MGDGHCCGNGRGLLLADELDLIQCGWENKSRESSFRLFELKIF